MCWNAQCIKYSIEERNTNIVLFKNQTMMNNHKYVICNVYIYIYWFNNNLLNKL